MNCPKCKAELPEQAPYCIQCGAALSSRRPEAVAEKTAEGREAEGKTAAGGFRFEEKAGAKSTPVGPEGEWTPPAGYARPVQRLGAFVLDFLFLGAGVFFMIFLLALFLPSAFADEETAGNLGSLISFLLSWGYYAGLESSPVQATPGKIVLGIKVTDLMGRRIGFGRATARQFAKIISGMLLFAGYVMILFTRRKQGLHDMMSGCLVISRQEGERTAQRGVRP